MLKNKLIPLALVGLAILGTPAMFDSAFGQTTAFTYQGRLTLNGTSPGGSLDLTFRLFDDATAGAQIGNTLTNSNLSVSNGLVTVLLDFGGGAFPGADRWLQIGVRTNGSSDDFTTLSPRQALTPTPYAMTAANFAGPILDAQLSANVARLDGSNAFTGTIKSVSGGTEFFMVPAGVIVLWSGSAATIPAGWALCNGNNGTPDLRDRFLVGAGGAYAVGNTGGATNHTHDTVIGTPTTSTSGAHTHTTAASTTGSESAHTHSVNPPSTTTSSNGAHTHGGGTLEASRGVNVVGTFSGGSFSVNLSSGSASGYLQPADWNGATDSQGAHTHTLDIAAFSSAAGSAHSHSIPALATDSQGAHTHSVAIGTVTSTSSDSRPPYYALCYIMKL
jgi:hypothetical protein